MEKVKIAGQTKDTGWQFGIRKSVPLNANEVWAFLFSESGARLWLKGTGKEFSTFKDLSHIRTKWKLKGWANEATLQMRVISNKDKTTIAFHVEKLLNGSQREETKTYWDKVIKIIAEKITANR
ncbi:hypothetical protein A8C56_13595 [Niabella ginsenosidivorans]|uniref:ATPase n=1 Tax=Niabella ginsenosidivorans TaxID=1176587 RepID=A0A1A9I487_9BACT|nr:hypothetical protein [Niabella ginsenosidivorans]ANH81869.1 hypothetical protein A8C56_13595 [Niabella ginsenosidivorans]